MIAGQNVLCFMAERGQWHVNNVCNLNMNEEKGLKALAKECTTKANHKNYEQKEVRVGRKVGDWIQSAKHAPITCFFTKHNNELEHNKNKHSAHRHSEVHYKHFDVTHSNM